MKETKPEPNVCNECGHPAHKPEQCNYTLSCPCSHAFRPAAPHELPSGTLVNADRNVEAVASKVERGYGDSGPFGEDTDDPEFNYPPEQERNREIAPKVEPQKWPCTVCGGEHERRQGHFYGVLPYPKPSSEVFSIERFLIDHRIDLDECLGDGHFIYDLLEEFEFALTEGATKPVALFQLGNFHLHSGEASPFKIECDALTDADWECLAYLLAARLQSFGSVEGVPEGGMKLAAKMTKYVSMGPPLIVDDVFTTGDSMQSQRGDRPAIGAVIFARNQPLGWITALFELSG